MSTWECIDSAPLDGSPILVCASPAWKDGSEDDKRKAPIVAFYSRRSERWMQWAWEHELWFIPTHWMEVPDIHTGEFDGLYLVRDKD